MTDIVQKENNILRQIAKAVPPETITSPGTKRMIANMKRVLAKEPDGVGLAAPQIGVPLRIFIVSGSVFVPNDDNGKKQPPPDRVFINPEIIKQSKKTEFIEEGCLSVRNWYGQVKRAEKVTIRALNERGEKIKHGASGLLAQIFQHEVDHLNGILFTNNARNLRNIEPEIHTK